MAAPVVGNILEDILPMCLGIKPQYSDEDLKDINIDVPRQIGKSVTEAQEILAGLGFGVKVIGSGDSVTSQLPVPNAFVASGTTVRLYAQEQAPAERVTVPHLSGMTYIDAKAALEDRGLFVRTAGAPKSDSRTVVSVQSIQAGELVEYGTIIEITLINKDASERN